MSYSPEQLELQAHLLNKKAEFEAWIAEDPENRGGGYLTTDLEHWAEQGVFSVADLERQSLINYIYDGFKDAYGFRNRSYDFDNMTMAELEAEADRISEAVGQRIEEDRKAEEAAVERFEQLLTDTMAMGAGDRETALRWIRDADEWNSDPGYMEFEYGLPYGWLLDNFPSMVQGKRYMEAWHIAEVA